jgi:hypothetical protein
MARYVVMEFEDNADAEAFVKSVQSDAGIYMTTPHPTVPDSHTVIRPSHNYNVVGLYMRPTSYCTCDISKKNQGGFTQGLKFGIYVHAACAKMAHVAFEAFGHSPGLGRNLLADRDKEGNVWGLLRMDGSVSDFAKRPPFNIPGKGLGR